MIIEQENRLIFCDHDGRHYNVIITYDGTTFSISKPKNGMSWTNKIPENIGDYLRHSEIERLKEFIEKVTSRGTNRLKFSFFDGGDACSF